MSTRSAAAVSVIWLILAIGFGVAGFNEYSDQEVEIPILKKVEQLNREHQIVEVKEIENKFAEYEWGIFAGGGAGGLGAPQIKCFSPEQFLELTEDGEMIFVANSVVNHGRTFIRQYGSFIKEKPVMLTYLDQYEHREHQRSFKVSNFEAQKVVFSYHSENKATFLIFASVSVIGALFAWLMRWLVGAKE